jgi:hypothetical protein
LLIISLILCIAELHANVNIYNGCEIIVGTSKRSSEISRYAFTDLNNSAKKGVKVACQEHHISQVIKEIVAETVEKGKLKWF